MPWLLRATARDARKHCISCMCIMLMINVRKLRAESRVGVRRQIRNLWSTRLKRQGGLFYAVKTAWGRVLAAWLFLHIELHTARIASQRSAHGITRSRLRWQLGHTDRFA